MKKLFSIESKGFFWIEEENSVYSIFDRKSNSHCFYDVNGKVLPNYKRPKIDYEDNNIEYNLESNDDDTLVFNKYGVACGDGCLVDKDGNEISDTKINQTQVDYIVLVYLGYLMYNQEKQGKAVSGFPLTILNGFIKNLYGDNQNGYINATCRKYYSRSQGSRC